MKLAPGSRRGRSGPRSAAFWAIGALLVLGGCTSLAAAIAPVLVGPPPIGSGRAHHERHAHARRARSAPINVSVTIRPTAALMPLPRSYFGLSTEYWSLPLWAAHMGLLERLVSLLRVPGDGPLVLRVGGDSADHSIWDPRPARVPAWEFALAPPWLRQARALVRRDGVRLIIDLNLITGTPAIATRWAQAALAGLPRGSIEAFEIGNEPDIYSVGAWLAATGGATSIWSLLPVEVTKHDYVRDFSAYAAALERLAPNVRLAGPALANPAAHISWVPALIRGDRRSLGIVTVHRYPYSGCPRATGPRDPTIARLLSPGAITRVVGPVEREVRFAHSAGLPLRLTELNSIDCGGRPGVSNTFATALWAPDALFALARARVDGVNLHIRANTINAPFALGPRGLTARPLMYGLLFFVRALGSSPRLVALRKTETTGADVSVWAVRSGRDVVHVVLIDKGPRPARVTVSLPATGPARVIRLLAPSPRSLSGVTLAGRRLMPDGRWSGRPSSQTVDAGARGYVIDVPAHSAAMLSARVAPRTLGLARP